MSNLTLTERQRRGKGTVHGTSRAAMSNAQFSSLSRSVVPVTVKSGARAPGWVIDTESKQPKKYIYSNSYGLAIHIHADGYGVFNQVVTLLAHVFQSQTPRRNCKMRWLRLW